MMCVSQVRQDILNCGLMPKDIRLIRKKDTGNYCIILTILIHPYGVIMHMNWTVIILLPTMRFIQSLSLTKLHKQKMQKIILKFIII